MIWTTKAGKKIALVDMTTSHICNCLAMLRRAGQHYTEKFTAALCYSGSGDIATQAADSAVADASGAMLECDRVMKVMRLELDRRGERE